MFAAVLLAASSTCLAEAEVKSEAAQTLKDDWSFTIAPYGWLAGVKGTVWTDGVATDLDIPVSDFIENTQSAFQVYAQARYKKFYLAFDGTWATLGGDIETSVGPLAVSIDQRIYDIRLGALVAEKIRSLPDEKGRVRRTFGDVYLGARYFSTEVGLSLDLGLPRPIEKSSGGSRYDPFVGFQAGFEGVKWGFLARGDVGGFGVGSAARFSWQLQPMAVYKVTSRLAVLVGYRVLSYDTTSGTGAELNGEELTQHGPMIGAGFHF